MIRELPSYRRQGGIKRTLRGFLFLLLSLFLSVIIVEQVFVNTRFVDSVSMEPALKNGDAIVVSPFLYGKSNVFDNGTWFDFSKPKRGEVVVVLPPYSLKLGFFEKIFDSVLRFVSLGKLEYHPDRSDSLPWETSNVVRRIIAVAGDEVYYSAGIFFVRPKGAEGFLDEHQVSQKQYLTIVPPSLRLNDSSIIADKSSVLTVPENKFFVAADNRFGFLDSRHWGLIGQGDLRGLVLLRVWPFERFGELK